MVRKTTTSRPWVHKPAATGVNVDYNLFFNDYAGSTQDITQLRPLGFQVTFGPEAPGSDRANDNGGAYYWVAFGPHAAGHELPLDRHGRRLLDGHDRGHRTARRPITGTRHDLAGGKPRPRRRDRDPLPQPADVHRRHALPGPVGRLEHARSRCVGASPGTSGAGLSYLIRRQHATLTPGTSASPTRSPAPTSRRADREPRRRRPPRGRDRLQGEPHTSGVDVNINAATTDPTHDIIAHRRPRQPPHGHANTGVVVDFAPAGDAGLPGRATTYVTIEWLETRRRAALSRHPDRRLDRAAGHAHAAQQPAPQPDARTRSASSAPTTRTSTTTSSTRSEPTESTWPLLLQGQDLQQHHLRQHPHGSHRLHQPRRDAAQQHRGRQRPAARSAVPRATPRAATTWPRTAPARRTALPAEASTASPRPTTRRRAGPPPAWASPASPAAARTCT